MCAVVVTDQLSDLGFLLNVQIWIDSDGILDSFLLLVDDVVLVVPGGAGTHLLAVNILSLANITETALAVANHVVASS